MEKTDTWAAFGSEYIKAIDVLNDTDEYAIVSVSSKEETRNNKTEEVLHLTIERNGAEKLFGCNKTNAYTIQVECPNSPKDAVGRVITFNKVDVQKPGTTPPEMVKGLRIKFKPIKVDEPSQVDTNEAGLDENNEM